MNGTLTHNVLGLCVRWGFPALKPIDSTNFNLSTNDYSYPKTTAK